MKSKDEILKPLIESAQIQGIDFTVIVYNDALEALEEYANQFKPQPKSETWKQALADHTCHHKFEDMNTSEMEVAEFVAGTISGKEVNVYNIKCPSCNYHFDIIRSPTPSSKEAGPSVEALANDYSKREYPIKTEEEYYKNEVDEPYYDYSSAAFMIQVFIRKAFKAGYAANQTKNNKQNEVD